MISLSFDPFYDTPEIMRLYGKDLSYVKADWGFLTSKSLANLEPILESYDQPVIRKYNDDGSYAGVESHLLRVFLIDDKKLIRNVYNVDFLHPECEWASCGGCFMHASSPSACCATWKA